MTSPEDENLEEALRRSLAEAASEVEPGANGLDKIRERVAGRPPRPWLISVLIGLVDRARHWTWRGHWAWRDPLRSVRVRRWCRSRRSNFHRRGIGWLPLVTAIAGVAVLAGIVFGIQPIRQEILDSTPLKSDGGPPQASSGVAGNGTATGGNGTPAGGGAVSSQQAARGSNGATSTHSTSATAYPLSGASCPVSPLPVTTLSPAATPTASGTGPETTPVASATASPSGSSSPADLTSQANKAQPVYVTTTNAGSCPSVTPAPKPSVTPPPSQTPSPSPSSASATPIATPSDTNQSGPGQSGPGQSGTAPNVGSQQTGSGASQSTTDSGAARLSAANKPATKAATADNSDGQGRPEQLSGIGRGRHDRDRWEHRDFRG